MNEIGSVALASPYCRTKVLLPKGAEDE